MEELFLKLLEKSVVGKNKRDINKYFNDDCFMEDSNGSIKVRDNLSEELVFVVTYNSHNIVIDIL